MLFLYFRFAVYLVAFGPTTTKFLELKDSVPERNCNSKKSAASGKNSSSVNHICSMSAETIREEVEFLKNDFNGRLKQVLFNTLLIIYHAAFLPCYFAQVSFYSLLFILAYKITFIAFLITKKKSRALNNNMGHCKYTKGATINEN